ncbi:MULTISPECIES: hypothetical protein [unclassified Sporosarcina]|uniref:hypothetical protein n=1 Tax=unclassified Sporosarcina TaxID=2647733 RepID=UPI00203E8F05|nr:MULTISPECIES: hypothetical protein [unclassified Sporosarcina]GKV65932.1 hypothetical protein NCCP2331_20850 [Sporosarcina sp. NCCP-2331]GLB56068.1 hypothetical protein NCCP2378_18550 [Sporosarcina sp. NCCP-2378]
MEKKLWLFMIFTAIILLGVSGCSEKEDNAKKSSVTEQPLASADEKAELPGVYEPKDVKRTDTAVVVESLGKQALFTENLLEDGKEIQLFVLPTDANGIQTVAEGEGSAFGQPGDRRYEGELLFYLSDLEGEEAYLQDKDSASYTLNLSNDPFTMRTVGDQSMLQIAEVVHSNGRELSLFTADQGLLHAVSVDGEPVLFAGTEKVKVVEGRYLQTYQYFNDEPLGWLFQTYEWHPDGNKLTLINERELFIEDEWKEDSDWYGEGFADEVFEMYKELIAKWHDIDGYVDQFPYRTFPDDLADRLKNGYILDEQLKVGESMEAYSEKHPVHLGEYEAEGGSYLAYPDGQNVFYDEYNDTVAGIELSGFYYKDTTARLRQLLGEPSSDSADYPMSEEDQAAIAGTNYDTGDILDYDIGDYHVKVEYEGEEVIGIYLH